MSKPPIPTADLPSDLYLWPMLNADGWRWVGARRDGWEYQAYCLHGSALIYLHRRAVNSADLWALLRKVSLSNGDRPVDVVIAMYKETR